MQTDPGSTLPSLKATLEPPLGAQILDQVGEAAAHAPGAQPGITNTNVLIQLAPLSALFDAT